MWVAFLRNCDTHTANPQIILYLPLQPQHHPQSLINCQGFVDTWELNRKNQMTCCQWWILLGSFFELQVMCVCIHLSVMSNSLRSPDCNTPGTSVHGILQARILEWAAFPFSRRSSWPRAQTRVSWIAAGFFTIWDTQEVKWRHIEKPKIEMGKKRIYIKWFYFY